MTRSLPDEFLLLSLIPLGEPYRLRIGAACTAIFPDSRKEASVLLACHGARATAILTNGVVGLPTAALDRLPGLELVCILGAGHEGVDVDALRRRGIEICHGPGTNTTAVAEHALALLLSLTRATARLDRALRAGEWKARDELLPILAGKNLGVFGMGRIGSAIADRAGPFGLQIGYTNRHERPDSRHRWFPSLLDLAAWSDFLVVSAPATSDTHHAIDAHVLSALGGEGYLVNVGRGCVVEERALVDALIQGTIAGAALDVFEHEPHVPAALRSMPNVVLSPHVAGRSPESRDAMVDLLLRNIALHRAGRPLDTPLT